MNPDHSNSKRDHSVWKWRDRRRKTGGSKGDSSFTYLYPAAPVEGKSDSLDGKLLHFDSNGISVKPSAPATEQLIQFRPHAVTASSVTLVEMLDVFRKLGDPQSRVFGGVYFGDAWKTRDERENSPTPAVKSGEPDRNFPLFSGVASPGSRVDVTLADEAGVARSEVTVYTDAGGNWVAPFEGVDTLETTWLAEISLLPAAWSGTVESRNFIISFPGGDILDHEDVQAPAEGELYGVVFATSGDLPEFDSPFEW